MGHSWKCQWCEVLEQEQQNVPDEERASRAWKFSLVPRAVGEALMREQGSQ